VHGKLFKDWFIDHFIEHALGIRPFLLLLDGDSSHYILELTDFAKQYGIVMFCLPPHTTHESQPLDTSVFRSLKQNWKAVCHTYMQSDYHKIPAF